MGILSASAAFAVPPGFPVPEPAGIMLLGTAVVGMVAILCRKRK